mgnify:CR=1 FL=1
MLKKRLLSYLARLNHIHCKAAEKLREGRLPKSSNDGDGRQPQSQKVTNGFHDLSVAESNRK